MKKKTDIILIVYTIILIFLSFITYSQIDLNLTVSSNRYYQLVQGQLINLGYYNRPLSALLFSVCFFLMFVFYLLIIRQVAKYKLSLSKLLLYIILSVIVLFFSYPAFSHDLFNYIFDARIITTYHLNPYQYRALDFPDDLWTRFMHWTHRTYPYGPVWLLITVPFSFLGFNVFTLTLFNFKLLFVVFHLGNIYLISRILAKVKPEMTSLGVAFYAFNPLIIVDSLISPHNEVIMLFFLFLYILWSLVGKNKLVGIICLLLSAGIKFVTIITLPLIFLKKRNNLGQIFLMMIILLLIVVGGEIFYREPYSWYFIPIVGVAALLLNQPKIRTLVAVFTFGALLQYIPYIYTGEYSHTVTLWKNTLLLAPVLLSGMVISAGLVKDRIIRKT